MDEFNGPEELINDGRYREALEALYIEKDNVEKRFGNDGYHSLQIHIKIGEVLCKQGYYNDAINILTDIEKKLVVFESPYSTLTIVIKETIANACIGKKHFVSALQIFEEIFAYCLYKFGANNPLTVKAKRKLALIKCKIGKYDEALLILEEVYKFRLNNFDIEHCDTIESYNDIATVYLEKGEYDKAMHIYENIYMNYQQKYPDQWNSLIFRCRVANVLKKQLRLQEAFQIYGEVYLIQNKMKPSHPDTLNTLENIADIFQAQGEYKTALLMFNKIYSIRSTECPMHSDTLKAEMSIATLYLRHDNIQMAVQFFDSMLRKTTVVYGLQSDFTLQIQQQIALLYFNHKIFAEALYMFEHLYQAQRNKLGAFNSNTLMTKINIGGALLRLAHYKEALSIFEEVFQIVLWELGPNNPHCITAKRNILAIYNFSKKDTKEDRMKYEASQVESKILETNPSDTLNAEKELNLLINSEPDSSLFSAINRNDLSSVKFCVEIENISIDAKDANGSTPLHIASEIGHQNIVKFLLNKGAFYNIRNKIGKTPKDLSAKEEIKSLFDSVEMSFVAVKEGNGADIPNILRNIETVINAKDEEGNTLLHVACLKRYKNTVQILLNNGADPKLVNKSGKTHFTIITLKEYEEIIDIFLRYAKQAHVWFT